MASPGSYSVVIIPLQSSSHSALQFFLWLKRMKELEREKDSLYSGLEVLDQAHRWFCHRIWEIQRKQLPTEAEKVNASEPSLYDSNIQRMKACLGSLICESAVQESCVCRVVRDSLTHRNRLLRQAVKERNLQISLLELEKEQLLLQLSQLRGSRTTEGLIL
ncbi:suppressor APC domain-containing protein 1 [Amia ocellicauda]|uniref:suppressor APC domain-containing protein 1 n=1 Tax=Amia ocellicauda TaxID=2972642 RepID=UPI003463AD98